MNTRFLMHKENPACKIRLAMSKTEWRSTGDICKLCNEKNTLRVGALIRMYSDEFGGVETKIEDNVKMYRLLGNMKLDPIAQSILDLMRNSDREWYPKEIRETLHLDMTSQNIGNLLIVLMTEYPITRRKYRMYHLYRWNHEED